VAGFLVLRPNNLVIGWRRRSHLGPGVLPDEVPERLKRDSATRPDTAADVLAYSL